MINKAAKIYKDNFGEEPAIIKRFETGLAHYVYYTESKAGEKYVVRLSRPETTGLLTGSPYWLNFLAPLGIKIPRIYKADLNAIQPYIILNYFEGKDLGHVYPSLSEDEKKKIAQEMVYIQKKVETLPKHKGYGFLSSYESEDYKNSWKDVLMENLSRSKSWLKETGSFPLKYVNQVEQLIPIFNNYLSRIEPKPFLDDTTTKNVLIHQGNFSGIVDIDEVCFGDKLFTVALTNMSLLNSGYDTKYIKYWTDLLEINEEERAVLILYTLIFCVNFMGEVGMAFNRDKPAEVTKKEKKKLTSLYEKLILEVLDRASRT